MSDMIEAGFMPWVVKTVKVLDDYKLFLTFADGKKGVYDAKPLLKRSAYKPLQSLSFFRKARVDGDSVVWNDDIDIAPELLYEQCAEVTDD